MAIAVPRGNLHPRGMKVTLDLEEALLAEAKALAAHRGITLARIVEEALQLRLCTQEVPRKRVRTHLRVFRGKGGLQPGADPRSNASLMQAAGAGDV